MISVRADLTKCEGYANCVIAAPEVFDLGPDGKVVVAVSEHDDDRHAEIEEAVRSCPVSALSLSRR